MQPHSPADDCYAGADTYTYRNVYTHAYTYAYTYVYTHAYTHAYTYVYSYNIHLLHRRRYR
jgi:hypothetical protein